MEQFAEKNFYTPDMAKIILILSAEEGIFTKKEVEKALNDFFGQWFELFDEEKDQIISNMNPNIDFVLELYNYMKKKFDVENDKFKTIVDLKKKWKKINNLENGYPQSTIIFKK